MSSWNWCLSAGTFTEVKWLPTSLACHWEEITLCLDLMRDLYLIFFFSGFLCVLYHIYIGKCCMRFMYLCTWFNIGNASIFTTFLLGTLNTTFICSHMKGQAVMLGTAAWPDVNIPTDPTCFWVGILVSIIHTSLRKPLLYRLAFEGPYQTVARMLEAQQSVRFLRVRLRFFFPRKKKKNQTSVI